MKQTSCRSFDAAIIGSGFAGSILAGILSRHGMRVALIDVACHPRFAIGESSTPIADMLLRRLGERYAMNELVALSTWGRWQQSHPELAGGRKRGFTYFQHHADEPFSEQRVGENSLWVAASKSDDVADTHWYRPDVDQFLFQLAVDAGATDLSGHVVESIEQPTGQTTSLQCSRSDATNRDAITLNADWLIDASGQSGVLARMRGCQDQVADLKTKSFASFAHFRGVRRMSDWLETRGIESSIPFDADDAAQHHLLSNGWMWMLRMNNGITSVGMTSPAPVSLDWSSYPTICDLMSDAVPVEPPGVVSTGRRLQRWFDPVVGDRQLMLPTAALTLDPLHSTGIAHALAGVDRVARIVMEANDSARSEQLKAYRVSFRQEVQLLDRLVATAYATMSDFPCFTIACMLYFAAAIRCEERYQQGEDPEALWNADDAEFVRLVDWASQELMDVRKRGSSLDQRLREQLKPWNSAGLMDPAVHNRYAYTAATK
jgi:FADH2 O2-dependent halogenase